MTVREVVDRVFDREIASDATPTGRRVIPMEEIRRLQAATVSHPA